MSEPLPPGAAIGIIGGGQLGRMLAMAAARLGYDTVVLEPDPHSPAARVASHHIEAPYDDRAALEELAGATAVVTYEFENVPVDAAERLSRMVPVHPPPAALAVSQDRLAEKSFLAASGISTAAHAPVDSAEDLVAALAAFGGSGVLKTRRLGYDGKGQHRFSDAGAEEAREIFARMGSVPLILEAFIPFDSEISVIAARGRDGAAATWEPAANRHEDGILRRSTVPAAVSRATADGAREAACALMDRLDYVGVLGLEFFVLQDGSLLANEFAPRVHNSGHWTEAACAVSQFEQHVRAVAGLPLGSTARHSDCVMENLIGDEIGRAAELLREPDLLLHLYGKAEARPGRKMGHFTRLTGPAAAYPSARSRRSSVFSTLP